MRRSRLENLANWVYDNWRSLLIPLVVVMFAFVVYMEATNDNPLRDRTTRSKLFDELVAEMKGIEIPSQSAINKAEAGHKASSIFIKTRYRTELAANEFAESIDASLRRRGWIPYKWEDERIAIRTYRFCRGAHDAQLLLLQKSVFDSDAAEYWDLYFTVGLGPGKTLFGRDPLPESCRR